MEGAQHERRSPVQCTHPVRWSISSLGPALTARLRAQSRREISARPGSRVSPPIERGGSRAVRTRPRATASPGSRGAGTPMTAMSISLWRCPPPLVTDPKATASRTSGSDESAVARGRSESTARSYTVGQRMIVVTAFYLGDPLTAREYLERASAGYTPQRR